MTQSNQHIEAQARKTQLIVRRESEWQTAMIYFAVAILFQHHREWVQNLVSLGTAGLSVYHHAGWWQLGKELRRTEELIKSIK